MHRWLASGFIALLMLLPAAGSPSPLKTLENVLGRLAQPITPDEQSELDLLSCLEVVGHSMVDRSDVQILTDGNSYLHQRAQDILYPRVRLVAESADYAFLVGYSGDREPGDIVAAEICGGLLVEVISLD